MSGKPFDTNELIQNPPKDWSDFLGLPADGAAYNGIGAG